MSEKMSERAVASIKQHGRHRVSDNPSRGTHSPVGTDALCDVKQYDP
jgi:hypothetical protein